MVERHMVNLAVVLVSLLWFGNVQAERAGDITKGSQLALICSACHSMAAGEGHKLGPNLWDIVGRSIGVAEDYEYSPSLSQKGGSWTPATLDQYLASPASFIPGNKMTFPGIADKNDRAAVVAYLGSLRAGEAVAVVTESNNFDYGGLAEGEGRRDVYTRCSACHSLMIVKQQGMSRDRWDETLDWMVEEQGMDETERDERERILRYLAEYYGG